MKKPYQKPLLLAESFALAEHIAECSERTDARGNQGNAEVCTYTAGTATLFYDASVGCVTLIPGIEGDLEWEPILQCYNSPFVGDVFVTAFGS